MHVHVLSEERGTDDPNADGYLDWVRPTCSCGWKGSKWHAYHNFQWSEAAREGSNHIRAARYESER